jgi:hypothetical protein
MSRHRRYQAIRLAVLLGMFAAPGIGGGSLYAQSELLPLDHPATQALIRIYEYGGVPEFPREQLPISRGFALELLRQAERDTLLPEPLRQQARYYRVELAADAGETTTSVFIPTRSDSHLIYHDPFEGLPIALLDYRDTVRGVHLVFEGIADGELRLAPDESQKAMIFQGGFQLRGTLLKVLGFGARITNGTIVGDTLLTLRDPRFSHSAKLGVLHVGRDIDFGSGHLRADFTNVALEIGREKIQLGGGLDQSLLVGSDLPSSYDYLRLSARVGRVSFTHLHASLLAPSVGAISSGIGAVIPQKYLASHIISFGPFGGIRGSLGESVIYSRRPFEIGYLNPLNFIKSQEHYLRDRDNTNMYAALSVNPAGGVFVEGEFLLDDLKFSRIGDGFWGNKSAWRIGARTTAFPLDVADLSMSYTRLEPYVFTHFDPVNSYTHDGTMLAGGGLEPNSEYLEGALRVVPLPNLRLRAVVGIGKHGANITVKDASGRNDSLVRNVGGDVRYTNDEIVRGDSPYVTFLDGNLEKSLRLRLEAEYEPLRNVYLRLIALRNRTDSGSGETTDMQLWFGLRLGAY